MVVAHYTPPDASAETPHALFYGHYDVQPADPLDLWHTPPFEPQRRKNKKGVDQLVGRGTSDDKGQVMTFVEGSGFSEKKLMQKVDAYTSADPAPELKVAEWIGQQETTLEQLRGKIVLLDFWATWCGPCISTFPRLRGWHKKYSGNDFVIIGVTQYYGEQEGKRVTELQEIEFLREFREKYKLPYGFAVARAGEAQFKYGINAYPTTMLLDRNGVVRYIGIGSSGEESENLEDTIKKILKEETRLAIR